MDLWFVFLKSLIERWSMSLRCVAYVCDVLMRGRSVSVAGSTRASCAGSPYGRNANTCRDRTRS